MRDLLAQIITYIFVVIIYLFIYAIIRMIFLDIRAMNRKKTGALAEAYLKLINLRSELDFDVEESYELEEDTTIGRGGKCGLCVDDRYLSQKHCRIFKRDGSFYIEDLDSTNGTFLNGEQLGEEAVELFDGDKLGFGRVSMLFVLPGRGGDEA